jgi:hypothetical protein
VGHPHTPFVQTAPGSQALPHAPQFFGSVVAAMQPMTGPQSLSIAGHPHVPALHTPSGSQVLPHVAQFFGSVAVLVQAAPHTWFGARHPASVASGPVSPGPASFIASGSAS